MTRTAHERNVLTHQRAARVGRSLSPQRFMARLALVVCAWLAVSSAALGQNVQFTQGSVGSGLTNSISIPIASYPGRGAASLPVTLYYSSNVWRVGYKKAVRADFNYRRSVAEAIYAERSAAGWTTSLDVPQVEWPKPDDYYWYDGKPTHTILSGYNFKVARVFIHMPDGSTHELRKADAIYPSSSPGVDMTGDFYAVDGSRMRFQSAGDGTGTLYLPDGSRYVLEEGGNVKLIDCHGNTLLYDAQNRHWTDTLGETLRGHIKMPWPANPAAGGVYYYTPPGFTQPYIFRWKSLSEVLTQHPGEPAPQVRRASSHYLPTPASDPSDWNAGNFPQPVPAEEPTLFYSAAFDDTSLTSFTYVVGRGQGANDLFNPAVLAEVELPNGLKYQFTYNEYGEIDKVVYPTGGYERLKHGAIQALGNVQAPYDEASRGVKNRWVSPNGTGGADELPWTYETVFSDIPNSQLVQTTAPDGTFSKVYRHNFSGASSHFGYLDERNGMTFDERIYTKDPGQGGVMLRRTLTEWAQSSFSNTVPKPDQSSTLVTYVAHRNPRPVKSVSLMLDTGGSALAKKVTYQYQASDPEPNAAQFIEKTTGLDRTGMTESLFAEIDPETARTGALSTILGYTFPAAGSTTTVYLNNEAYRERNLLGLVTSVVLKDAAGQPVSKTETFYDEALTYPVITFGDLGDDWGYIDPGSNARGNPTTVRRYVNASASVAQEDECTVGVCLQTHAQFDQYGNPINYWDARGVQSQKEYAAAYRHAYLTKSTSAAPDPNGEHGSQTAFTSESTYEAATGLALTTKDANDQITKFSYDIDPTHRDPLNRPRKVERPDGSWTKTDYNDVVGNLYVHTETQLDAVKTTHAYQFFDKLGRASRTLSRELGTNYIVAETRYDRMGRVSQTFNPIRTTISGTGNASAAAYWTTAAQPTFRTQNEYDTLGRVTKVTLPDDTVVTTLYEGVYTTVTDQAGRRRRQKADALGRLIRVDEPDKDGNLDPVGVSHKNLPVQPSFYEYDTLGNVVRINQGLAQAGANPEATASYVQHRYFKYDALSRLTYEKQVEQAGTINDPATGQPFWSRQLTYDEPRDSVNNMGLLSKAEDARHVYSFFHYDQLGRNHRVDYSDGTPSLTSSYDEARTDDTHPAGEPAVVFKNNGRLTEVKTGQVTTAEGWTIPQTQQLYDYDLMGRTRRQQQVVGASTYELRYAYDLGGGLISERYPTGRVVSYSYDGAGRLLSAGSGSTTYASDMTYTPFGGMASMTLGNGAVYSMAYDEKRLQLSDISLKQGTNVLQKYEYKYGEVNMATGAVDASKNNGQIARIESTVGAQMLWQQRFEYDTLGRLSAAREHYGDNLVSRTYLLNYDYDVYGNRYQKSERNQNNHVTQEWVEDSAYGATTNRFVSSNMAYDDAGNLVVDGRFRQRKYEYDANNRQRRSSNLNDTGAVRSVYDGAGQRVATVAGGILTDVMVYDAAGDLVAEYGGSVLTNGTQYVMSDQQGSTRLTMSSAPVNNQLVVARQDYLPFGEDVSGAVGPRAGMAGYDQSTNPRQKYAGMEQDDSTGMSHTQWREFDSLSARWTAPDPYGGSMEASSPQSFNRYTYVNNDPVNKVDPTGLMLSDIGVVQTNDAGYAQTLQGASDASWMKEVNRQYASARGLKVVTEQVAGGTRYSIATRQQRTNAAFVGAMGANAGGSFANYFGGKSGVADNKQRSGPLRGSSPVSQDRLHPTQRSYPTAPPYNPSEAQPAISLEEEFETEEGAAVWALSLFNPASIYNNLEAGGSICRKPNGKFIYSTPNWGGDDNVFPRGCPAGTMVVATYHTHGGPTGNPGDELFSDTDRRNANIREVTNYLATPSGAIARFIPNLRADAFEGRGTPQNFKVRTSVPLLKR